MENGKRLESEDLLLIKQVDRLVKNPIQITGKSKPDESDDSDSGIFKTKMGELKKQYSKPKKATPKPFRITDLDSSSSSDSEIEAAVEVTSVTKLATASLIPDRSEAVRQALLADSNSDSDFDMDTQETENIPDEVQESTEEKIIDECEVVIGPDDNGIIGLKEEVVGANTDEEGSVKVSNLKTDKLLRMSLDDPEAESDSKKSQKGKESKKDKKKTKERKKRRIHSDSDFESSESEKEKKKRKRKRSSPSDDEGSDDDDFSKDDKKKSKSRRRIKKAAQTSDSDNSNDSDIEVLNESQRSEAGGSKGRKNIKKIMKDTNLKVSHR